MPNVAGGSQAGSDVGRVDRHLGTAAGTLVATWTDLPTAILLGGALATVSGVAAWVVLFVFREQIADAFRDERA